ncbi:MAG: nuclear transport factor 2 family protein [Acidobacteria bacterium]|nr:nuclear transport factor 2 family protein [Acidobacteriota bacterium]
MKAFVLTMLLLAVQTCVQAQQAGKPADKSSGKSARSTEQELIALNQELIDALARGDRAAVDRIYAPEFVRTTVQGGLLTKAQALDSIKAPADGVKITYESKEIQVFDYGNAAVLAYLSIRHTENKGEKSDFLYRVTDTFIKRDGRWLKVASAGTPVVAKP